MAKQENGKIGSSNHKQLTFNLKAVVQETGLKPDTLRAWERRYGLPQPRRTGGGHRLYTRRDIETLKWLVARQEDGLSISRAVSTWQALTVEGKDPLLEPLDLFAPEPTVVYTPLPTPAEIGSTIHDLRQSWVNACLDFDEQLAESVLNQAFALYQPEIVCLEVLQKGLAHIGEQWYQGAVSVQKEHFASALALRRLDALLAATPSPTRNGRLLVGCAPKEDHTFSALLLTLLLRRQGWEVVYLGANVPIDQLENTINTTKPHLVIFSAQLLHTAATLQQLAYLLQDRGIPLAYGGLVFNSIPKLREYIPGYFLGTQIDQASKVVEHLLTNRPPLPHIKRPTDEYSETLVHFQRRLGLIEASIWDAIAAANVPISNISEANSYLGQNIKAALMLGNVEFLGSDIEWIEGLLVNYKLPVDQLHRYLQIYSEAAKKHLHDVAGAPVLFWLDKVINSIETRFPDKV
ncbi:MAG: MerR family transcriptional regulator [Anaerolineales bacterium]|nr:MerR family transcriptional regulator [Anaerolineales bacterium]